MSGRIREISVEEDVLREHRELETWLTQVHEMFHKHRTKRPEGAAKLMDALDELREHLGMMFALKEADGHLDGAETRPSLSEQIESLKTQHAALFEDLSRLIDQCDLDVARGRWERTWKFAELTFENFCEQFHDHEAGEAQCGRQSYEQEHRGEQRA